MKQANHQPAFASKNEDPNTPQNTWCFENLSPRH